MKSFLSLFSFFILLGFLSGCCVAESCECPGQEAADDIALRFNRDTIGVGARGFTQFETFRLLLIRTPIDRSGGARADTLLLDKNPVAAPGAPDLLIRRDRPFARSVIGIGGYRYSILLPRKPGLPILHRFELTDVAIQSRYTTVSSCCTCYENLRKEARLDGGALRDLHTAPTDQPVLVELRKP